MSPIRVVGTGNTEADTGSSNPNNRGEPSAARAHCTLYFVLSFPPVVLLGILIFCFVRFSFALQFGILFLSFLVLFCYT